MKRRISPAAWHRDRPLIVKLLQSDGVLLQPRYWYEALDGRLEFRIPDGSSFERLMNACGDTSIPLWLAAQTAAIIAERRGCELVEAWDRVACNLEHQLHAVCVGAWGGE